MAFGELAEVAEPVPGPTTDLVAGFARRHHCYIICPLTTIHGDKYMNDSVLLDCQGQVVVTYSKVHPVVEGSAFTSLEKGMTPGSEAKVFEADFGRIGMQICFDINWDAGWAELKRKGGPIPNLTPRYVGREQWV